MASRMRYRAITVLGTLGLLGVFACGGSESAPTDDFSDFGVSPDELGVEVVSCSQAGSSGYSGTTLTLDMGAVTTIVVNVDGTAIKVNGYECVDSSGDALTKAVVKKIVINGTDGQDDKVILDLLPGSFGYPIFSYLGGITVDLGSGTDSFMIRGTATGADNFTMGVSGTDVYAEVSGDSYADVKVTDAESYTVSLSGGNDTFTAAGGAKNAAHLTTGVTTLTAMTTSVKVYGGEGNDTLTGGSGADVIYGGPANDTFLTDATGADGADQYYGGAGTDTMSYASRTDPVVVVLGPAGADPATRTGTADLATGGTLATETLKFSVDGGNEETVTFATPANTAAVLAAINAVHTGVASDDGLDHLVLTGTTSFEVTGGTALTKLGLTSDAADGKAAETDFVNYEVENVTGGLNDDTLTGSNVSNTILGGAGADTIWGGVANGDCADDVDVLKGEAGNDAFTQSASADCGDDIYGGADTDTVTYHERTAELIITIDAVANDGDGSVSENDNVRTDVEEVFGGTAGDTITGGTLNETLHGGPGADTISGGSGNDTMIGGTGDDTLNGDAGDDIFDEEEADDAKYTTMEKGYGNDIINGGAGFDKVSFSDRAAILTITLCVDTATQGAGSCTANDGEALVDPTNNLVNVEHIVGGVGADSITGSTADERLEGGAGADELTGGAGNDTLFGDADLDTLHGGDGDDYLDGGDDADNDLLFGDAGDGDICVAVASDVLDPAGTCEM